MSHFVQLDSVFLRHFDSVIQAPPLLLDFWRREKSFGILGTWLASPTSTISFEALAISLPGAEQHANLAAQVISSFKPSDSIVLAVKDYSCESLRSADAPEVELIDKQVIYRNQSSASQLVSPASIDRIVRFLEWPNSITFGICIPPALSKSCGDNKICIKNLEEVSLHFVYIQAFDDEGAVLWINAKK